MTYPDGEVVDYTYNRAGNLQSMQGKKESHTYDYIKQLAYDEFEQRKYLKYGNDTETNYSYDPTMRRLQQLQVKSGSRQVMNNSYGYDLVGNVLNIKNSAPIVNNTLGGTSNHEYQYDEFYRLKNAKALYNGEFTKASYELNMSYNTMHNITKKDLVHTVNNEQKGYVLDYNYDNEAHPNAPSSIQETTPTTSNQQPRTYVYDGNGNPTSYSENQSFRKMTWDEENRLMGINDNGRIHQYTYDAGGERVIKSSGDSQHIAVNGQTAATIVHTDDYTGYVSPYFVISKGKFTKHYFEGAGRIVSKLGNGSFAQPLKLTAGGVNYSQRTAEEQKAMDAYVKTLGVPPGPATQQGIYATPEFTGDPYPSDAPKPVEENQEPPEGWPRNPVFNKAGDVPGPPVQFGPPVQPTTVAAGEGFTGIGLPENDIFYFHPDHLGSTSYITTRNGSISQHVEYIAFGEILFEEHSSSFSSPYLFNGKELDRETNLSYYGARYLDMKTSLWLNVDPLAGKMPFASAYIYCFNNPIVLTDPDGREPVPGLLAFNPYFKLKATQWYMYTDGVYHSKSFNAAATYCTKNLRADAYQTVYQRNAYYGWVQSQANAKGYKSKWFGAAELVTGLFAVGATESINLNVIKDNTESFLKAGNKFLFSHNMKNAKDLLADGKLSGGFTDANGKKQSFQGLTGIALDNKMVEFEQSKVQEYINGYKGNDLNAIITNINEMFTGTVAKTMGPGEINEVMKDSFNGGKSFNFKNYADRVKLGQELIKKAYSNE